MKPNLWDKLATGLFVTIIATMVWLYAEGRTVSEVTKRVTVRFVAPQGQEALIAPITPEGRLTRLETVEIQLTVGAAQSAVSRLDAALTDAISLEISPRDDTQDQLVDTAELLSRALLDGMGITLKKTTPEQIRLHVEPLVTLTDVPLKVTTLNGEPLDTATLAALENAPTTNPETVTVKLPRSLAGLMDSGAILARIDPANLTSNVRGQRQITAPLSLPDTAPTDLQPWVTITPPAAEVAFTLRQTTSRWVSQNPIPIWITGPPAVHDRFKIAIAPDATTNVSFAITGPASLIEALEAFPPTAFVEVTGAQANAALNTAINNGKTTATLQAPLRFLLPDGLRQDAVETDQDGPVQLTIQARPTPADQTP